MFHLTGKTNNHVTCLKVFFVYFWQATVFWPLFYLFHPFYIFGRCLDWNPESALARRRTNDLATHLPKLGRCLKGYVPPFFLQLQKASNSVFQIAGSYQPGPSKSGKLCENFDFLLAIENMDDA
jgi:hypothetical protein